MGFGLLGASALALVALAAYSPADPVFERALVSNRVGVAGASVAALLFRRSPFTWAARRRREFSNAMDRSATSYFVKESRSRLSAPRDASAGGVESPIHNIWICGQEGKEFYPESAEVQT